MVSLIDQFLSILPLGDWFVNTPFGMVYGTFIFSAFSCIVLLISKLVFKSYFGNRIRKILFLLFVAGPSLLISACFIYLTITVTYIYYTYSFGIQVGFSYLIPVYHGLTLIAYLFFIGYLIDFVIRLVRHIRLKKER
jgi:hypothetical protein